MKSQISTRTVLSRFRAAAGPAAGSNGVHALLIAKYLPKYIPGKPSVIVTYNPGGGGVVVADYTYNVAPKDGTWVVAPLQSMLMLQLVGKSGIRYDAGKFEWIGRAARSHQRAHHQC